MRKLVAMLLSASLFVLAACGGGAESTGQTKDQNLVVAVGGEAATLDPHKTFSGNSFVVTNQIYESLLARGEDGSLQPRLATEWTALNETTWELKLREGVKFHDGTDFNAEAVKFSINRLKDPETKAQGGFIVTMISDIKVVDPYTVHLITNEPFSPLPAHLAHPVTAMVSPKQAQEGDLGMDPVGTGPFKFQSWKAGESVTMVANDEYWGGRPKLNSVTMRVIPEAGTQLVELKAGTVHLINGLQPERFDEIANDSQFAAKRFLGWGSFYLGFNTQEGPLANKQVRQAIAYALDRDGMVDVLRQGMAAKGNAPVPPTVFGASSSVAQLSYDTAKAKELLQNSGVALPIKLKLHTYENAETKQIAGAIQAQLKEIGIELELSVTDNGAYNQAIAQKDHGLYLTAWGTVTMDADYAFWAWYHSTQHDSNNRAFYANAEVDQLLEKARSTSVAAERQSAYDRIQSIVADELPYLTLYYPLTNYAKSAKLEGELFPFAMINLDLRNAEFK